MSKNYPHIHLQIYLSTNLMFIVFFFGQILKPKGAQRLNLSFLLSLHHKFNSSTHHVFTKSSSNIVVRYGLFPIIRILVRSSHLIGLEFIKVYLIILLYDYFSFLFLLKDYFPYYFIKKLFFNIRMNTLV